MHKPFLVIAGNIGSGKSTVAERLGEELGLPVVSESSGDNPYLQEFYQDMASYAYRSQLFFLARGLHQHRQIEARGGGAVLDRSVYEDYLVFAHQLHSDGFIDDDDFSVLGDLYYGFQDLLPAPHLMVMLEGSSKALLSRSEFDIEPAYIESLQRRYQDFADGWVASPILKIDTEQVDPRSAEGLDRLVELVTDRLS